MYNINIPTKRKHIENDKTVLPFLADRKHVPVPVSTSTIPVITLTKKYILKTLFYEPTESTKQISDDSVMLENNFETAVPYVPTNIKQFF